MRTLTSLSLLLAVALGIPLELEQKEAQVPPPKPLQHPLVGDLLPVQGHVVEENPAPQPEPGKELHLSALSPDKEEQTSLQVQQDTSINEVDEEPQVMPNVNEDNNEIKKVETAAPWEEVSLDSAFTEQHIEGLQADQEPKAEISNDIVEEEENEQIQELENYSGIEGKYDFEQPVMELEPLTDEETQRDAVEGEGQSDMEGKYNFEQPIMKLEPLTDEEMQRDELLEVSDTKGVHEEPIMYAEPETAEGQFMNEMNLPDAGMAVEEEGPMLDAQGQPLQLTDEYFPHDEGFMKLEPLESEDHSQMLLSVEPVVQGLRSCSGVVLEGKCFQFFTNPKKASEAEYFCQQSFRGGHLASITCPNVHNQMMNLMRRSGGTRRTWVGGLRFLDTGRFVWLDGSQWGYADWLLGEPNNTANKEDCLELLASGKFNDFTCWEPQAFICSYPY